MCHDYVQIQMTYGSCAKNITMSSRQNHITHFFSETDAIVILDRFGYSS